MKYIQVDRNITRSFMSFAKRLSLGLAAVGALFALTSTSRAQPIYTNTFNTDDSANWVLNWSYGTPINYCNFNFDYTTLGIPIAPHSVEFGSAAIHHGLKLCQIWTSGDSELGVVAGVSASPTNFSIAVGQNFIMHADMWINVNCTAYATLQTNNVSGASYADNNHDGSASTVLSGIGFGTAGTEGISPGLEDCTFVGTLTDNGSSAQYRMYAPLQTSSYQNGDYQYSGTTTPGYPGDSYVYNIGNGPQGNGCRAVIGTTGNPPYTTNGTAQLSTNYTSGALYAALFPSQVCPLQEQVLYPQQTNNASLPGFLTFGWHDVSLEQVGNVLIYQVDGNIIATANYNSAGAPAGNYLVFMNSRTSYSTSTDPNYTNLNFVVFANIVVSNYNNVVNVTAPTPQTSESTPGSPGVFTITRSSPGVALTVNYTLTGTATNGIQYQTLPTSVTFSSLATSTNIYVVPLNPGYPNLTTTAILTIQPGAGYAGAGNALVDILDANTPTIDITGGSQAYGRYTNSTAPDQIANDDFISYTLTRRGQLTLGYDLNVNVAYSGSAVSGTDFTPVSSVDIPDGTGTASLSVSPVDNPNVTTNRTVIVSVTSGTGYAIGNGPATGTVVSAHYPPAPVLLADALTNSSDSTNWNITYGTGDPTNDAANYEVDFGLSLASAPGAAIPPPPNGNANALHMTCNKNVPEPNAAPGAVNVYYTNQLLSGNYAVRFNMNLIEGQGTANSTEGAVFGINHSGSLSNWWYGGGTLTANLTWPSDGIWYYMTAQPAGSVLGDYLEFTGAGGTNGNTGWQELGTMSQLDFTQVFKDTPGPFTCLDGFGNQTPGVPANGSSVLGYDDSTWCDVELRQELQQGGYVDTMSINHTPIFVYTNTTVWTSGYLMLGYEDPFGGTVGSADAGVYYANLQVVQLATTVTINSIAISGGNVVIKFTTSNASDTTSSFTLQSSATVNGPYAGVNPAANITSLGSNQFQATTPYNGGTQFYRILE